MKTDASSSSDLKLPSDEINSIDTVSKLEFVRVPTNKAKSTGNPMFLDTDITSIRAKQTHLSDLSTDVEKLIRDSGVNGVCFSQISSLVHRKSNCKSAIDFSIPGYSKYKEDEYLDKTCRTCVQTAKQILENGMSYNCDQKYLKVSAYDHYRFVYTINNEVRAVWGSSYSSASFEDNVFVVASKPWIRFTNGEFNLKCLEEYGKLILYTVMKCPGIREHHLVDSLPIFSKRDCWDLIDAFRSAGVFEIRIRVKTPETTLFSENEDKGDTALNAMLLGVNMESFDVETWRQQNTIAAGITYNEQIELCYYLLPNVLTNMPVISTLIKDYLESINFKIR